MKSRYLSFAPLSLVVRDPGLRDRDPRILRTFLSSPTAACGRTVIKTGRLLGIIAILDTVGEFAAVPTTGGKSGLCGPESPLSSQIPDGSGGNIERTPNSPTVSLLGLGPVGQKIAVAARNHSRVCSHSSRFSARIR